MDGYVFKLIIALVTLLEFCPLWAYPSSVSQKYFDAGLRRPVPPVNFFRSEDIRSKDFVHMKSAEWEACHQKKLEHRRFKNPNVDHFAADDEQNLSEFLETNKFISNLSEMEEHQLLNAVVPKQPWSGDYWSYANGLLGARRFDVSFSSLISWLTRFEFIKKKPASKVILVEGQSGVGKLSPSEKYDLLIGDTRSSFTQSMWAEGKKYYDKTGDVEGWMGLCHGWAPAAIKEERPQKAVDLLSKDRQWQIHLVPAEIKGLVSYNWATNAYDAVTLGRRCDKKEPKRDENGRLIDPECLDLNPATWHHAIVNRLGLGHQSFVMDVTYDYEVWNQPVLGYSYSYFNVKTKKPETNLSAATIALEDFIEDKFKKYRSPLAKSVVGITMRLGYVVETSVEQKETDSPDDDAIRWVSYDYDLELDQSGNIIGGEWYQVDHPDFVWTPLGNTRPRSVLERWLTEPRWRGTGPLSENWSKVARTGAARGVVLDSILQVIVRKSQ